MSEVLSEQVSIVLSKYEIALLKEALQMYIMEISPLSIEYEHIKRKLDHLVAIYRKLTEALEKR